MRKNVLAASLALAFGASFVGNAHADAIAQSVMNITSFQFLTGLSTNPGAPAPTTQLVNASQFSSLNIVDQTNLSPLLNGIGPAPGGYTTFTVGGAPLPTQI